MECSCKLGICIYIHGRYSQPTRSILCLYPLEYYNYNLPSLLILSSIGHCDKLLGLAHNSILVYNIEPGVSTNEVCICFCVEVNKVAGELVLV